MLKKIFRVVFPFLILLVVLVGCGHQTVNLREMTPEDQFTYAKKFYDKGDYERAKLQLMMVALNNPGSTISDKTQYYLADSHYHLKEYIQAIAEFEKLIRSLPQSPYVDDARYKIGMCYYKLSPGYALDQEYTHKAITQFEEFLDEFPNSDLQPEVDKRLHECREKLAKKEFKTAELYRKMNFYRAAVISYENVVKDFATSSFCDDAYYHMGECHLKMKDPVKAEEAFESLIRKFPTSTYVSKAKDKLQGIQAEQKTDSAQTG